MSETQGSAQGEPVNDGFEWVVLDTVQGEPVNDGFEWAVLDTVQGKNRGFIAEVQGEIERQPVFNTAIALINYLQSRYPLHEHGFNGHIMWVADIQVQTQDGNCVGIHVRNGKIVVGVLDPNSRTYVISSPYQGPKVQSNGGSDGQSQSGRVAC